jgi:hypothetical protein
MFAHMGEKILVSVLEANWHTFGRKWDSLQGMTYFRTCCPKEQLQMPVWRCTED